MIKRAFVLALAAAALAAGCYEPGTQSGTSSGSQSTTQSGTTSSTSTGTMTTTTTTDPGSAGAKSDVPSTGGKVHKLPSGLQYEDVTVGSGKMAEAGMAVSVQYTGRLVDGTEFDSSVKQGQPLKFQLGTGRVIQGWEEGISGMRIGGKRKLTIPPDLGYGARGYPPVIPPNSTLLFDIELLDVR